MPMAKISTLFYILDDTEEINEGIYDLDDTMAGDSRFDDISNYLDRCTVDVDAGLVRELVDKLMLL